MAELQKDRLLRELKSIVLNVPAGVTRAEAAARLGVDLRTAAGYLEQLTDSGFAEKKTEDAVCRGRPAARYVSCRDRLSFLGLSITQNLCIKALLIDSRGKVLKEQDLQLTQRPSVLSVFSSVLELARGFLHAEGYRLYGIGLAISRWLQPPLCHDDLYCGLAESLERELGIAVWRDVNINAVAYACACERNVRNLAVIHAGLVMEFGLIRGGEPDRRFAERENFLSHLCVNPEGRRCYCGSRGCLVNYVTADVLRERLEALRGRPEAEKRKMLHSLGEMLGEGIVKTAWEFPEIESILVYCDPRLREGTGAFCKEHNPRPESLTVELLTAASPVALGAAREAAFFELNRYQKP